MIKKIAFTIYPVKDMARAREFYEKKLNLQAGSISSQGRWVEYDLPGGGCFAISDLTGVKPGGDTGGSVAFEVDDLDQLVSSLKENGVTFKMDIMKTPVCRMAVALDSEGNALVLHQLSN